MGLIDSNTVINVAANGSPAILSGVGRLFGLGQVEQQALVQTGIPRLAILAFGIGFGVLAGIYAEREWPQHTRKMMR